MGSFKKGGKTSLRRAKNPEKRLPAIEATTEKKTSKTIAKKNQKKKPDTDEIMRRARLYHKLKREVLAPFIARLLLRHRWEEMTSNLDEEFSLFDLSNAQSTRAGNSTANFTLNPIDEEDSDASHKDDWRNQGAASSGASDSDSG